MSASAWPPNFLAWLRLQIRQQLPAILRPLAAARQWSACLWRTYSWAADTLVRLFRIDGWADASVATLAHYSQPEGFDEQAMSPRTMARALSALEALGVICVERVTGEDGWHNRYAPGWAITRYFQELFERVDWSSNPEAEYWCLARRWFAQTPQCPMPLWVRAENEKSTRGTAKLAANSLEISDLDPDLRGSAVEKNAAGEAGSQPGGARPSSGVTAARLGGAPRGQGEGQISPPGPPIVKLAPDQRRQRRAVLEEIARWPRLEPWIRQDWPLLRRMLRAPLALVRSALAIAASYPAGGYRIPRHREGERPHDPRNPCPLLMSALAGRWNPANWQVDACGTDGSSTGPPPEPIDIDAEAEEPTDEGLAAFFAPPPARPPTEAPATRRAPPGFSAWYDRAQKLGLVRAAYQDREGHQFVITSNGQSLAWQEAARLFETSFKEEQC